MALKDLVTEFLNDEANTDIVRDSLFHSDWKLEITKWDDEHDRAVKQSMIDANVVLTHKDNHGGEGEGEDYWSVYEFKQGSEKVCVKFQGWYASYNGSEFTEWFFVEPKEQMVIVYEKA
jgi:hypothetical protein